MAVLSEMGAKIESKTMGVGGSQELESLGVALGDLRLVVESETYVGLSVRGEPEVVTEVERRVRTRLAGT